MGLDSEVSKIAPVETSWWAIQHVVFYQLRHQEKRVVFPKPRGDFGKDELEKPYQNMLLKWLKTTR